MWTCECRCIYSKHCNFILTFYFHVYTCKLLVVILSTLLFTNLFQDEVFSTILQKFEDIIKIERKNITVQFVFISRQEENSNKARHSGAVKQKTAISLKKLLSFFYFESTLERSVLIQNIHWLISNFTIVFVNLKGMFVVMIYTFVAITKYNKHNQEMFNEEKFKGAIKRITEPLLKLATQININEVSRLTYICLFVSSFNIFKWT